VPNLTDAFSGARQANLSSFRRSYLPHRLASSTQLFTRPKFAKKSDDISAIRNINRANAHLTLADWRRARDSFERALVIEREIGNRRQGGTIISHLGLACYHCADFRRSIEYYDQCIAMANEAGNPFGVAAALVNKSMALEKLGSMSEAVSSAEAALRIFERLEAPDAAEARQWLAELRAASESEVASG